MKVICCQRLLSVHKVFGMNDLIKLIKTYRITEGLSDRLRLAEEMLPLVERDLRFFVFGSIRQSVAEDVFQEVLKAVFISHGKFRGSSLREFWAWGYRIARNKIHNEYTRLSSDRLEPMPQDELWELVESSNRSPS